MFKKLNKFINNIDFTSKGLLGFFLVYLAVSSFILVIDYGYVVKTPIVIINYVVLLGGLLAKNIGLNYKDDKLSFSIISAGLSIVGLMIWGLFINFTLPLVGILTPFSAVPLVSSLYLLLAFLGYWMYIDNQSETYKFEGFTFSDKHIYTALPLVILFISILGTGALNNTDSNYLLLFSHIFIALYFLYLFLSKREFSNITYFSLIYFSALSLLFTFSLRGHNILGWDINEEYQVFTGTLENLRWSMEYYKGLDYNACISITILPTIFKVLTGIESQYIFKFFFQLLFALLPVSVFVISKKYLSTKYSLASAMLFLSQTWFFEQMPALVRQEIAFLLYSVLIIVIFNINVTERIKYMLVTIFSIGIVISHYTTSYILLVILGSIFFGSVVSQKMLNKKINKLAGYILLILVVFVIFWQVLITNTGDAFGKFISFKDRKGIEVTATTTEATPVSSLQVEVEKRLNIEPSELKFVYYDVVKNYLSEQDNTKYDNIEASNYTPEPVNDIYFTNSFFPGYVDSFIAYVGKIIKLVILIVMPIYSLYLLVVNQFKTKNYENLDFIILNIVGVLLLSAMVLIPFLQIHYNVTRLFLQVLITLSLFVVFGLKNVTDKFRWSDVFMAGSIVVLFLFQSGFIGNFTGAYKRITLHPIPSDFYTYYINDTEVSSARWLGSILKADDKVQADNLGNLRLLSFANTSAYNTKIFPLSLRRDSFVYLIKINVLDRMAVLQYNNVSYSYEYPLEYLEAHKNTIYSNGESLIYR